MGGNITSDRGFESYLMLILWEILPSTINKDKFENSDTTCRNPEILRAHYLLAIILKPFLAILNSCTKTDF
jgi:hypothetical protein